MLPPELPLWPGICVAVGAGAVGFVVTVAVGTGVEAVLKRAVISTSSAGMVYVVSLLSGFSKVPLLTFAVQFSNVCPVGTMALTDTFVPDA